MGQQTRFQLAYDHHNMTPAPAGTADFWNMYESEDGILDFYGTAAPPTTASTYAEGCIYHKVNDTNGDTLYVNIGTYASPNFVKLATLEMATAADDTGPSPLLWDDAPLFEVIMDPGKGYFMFEDYLNSLTAVETGATLTTSSSGTFTDDPSVAGGVMVLDNAANTANIQSNLAWVNMQCKPGVGTHIYFEARVKIGVDTGAFLIGLHDDSTTDPLTASINTNTDHAVFFRDEGMGTAAVGHQACDGTNVTTSSTTIADSDKDEFENWGIHIFGNGNTAGDYVKFYHKGVLVATVTDADGGGDDGIPDAVICPTLAVDNVGDTIQSALTIDWMRLLVFNTTSGTARA